MKEKFQSQMKVIRDTAILTKNDEIKSRWKEYCEDWHLIEIVSGMRSRMRRPIGAAVRAVATKRHKAPSEVFAQSSATKINVKTRTPENQNHHT